MGINTSVDTAPSTLHQQVTKRRAPWEGTRADGYNPMPMLESATTVERDTMKKSVVDNALGVDANSKDSPSGEVKGGINVGETRFVLFKL